MEGASNPQGTCPTVFDVSAVSLPPRAAAPPVASRLRRPPVGPRPLLATGDPALLDELLDAAAEAAVVPDVVSDLDHLASKWDDATPVVVGADLLSGSGSPRKHALPARSDVVLAALGTPDEAALELAGRWLTCDKVACLPTGRRWLADYLRHRHQQATTTQRPEPDGLGPLGPLQPLLDDPDVTDVLVNGPDEVYVDAGAGLRKVALRFAHERELRALAVRLVTAGARRLDMSAPYADVVLPDGVRLHAVLAPIAATGPYLSLRIPRRRRLTFADLTAAGSIGPLTSELLRLVVRARLAALVSGGTGSGKTTLLGVLLEHARPEERLVLVEDVREVVVDHPHVVRLQARAANVEGAGVVSLRDLVRQALRMRPDRLVVGEVRGAEVLDLLVALNTGHDGGLATLHANSAADIPARLEALAALAGLGRAALHSQLISAVDVVIHLARRSGPDGRAQRCITELAVLERDEAGWVRAVTAVRIGTAGSVPALVEQPGPGATRLAELLGDRGVRPPSWLVSR